MNQFLFSSETVQQRRSAHPTSGGQQRADRSCRSRARGALIVGAVGLAAALAGCGHPQQVLQSGTAGVNGQTGQILLRNVRIAAPSTPSYSAGADADVWLTVLNEGAQPDALTGVSSPAAASVVIRWDPDCDGAASPVSALPLAAQHPIGTAPPESSTAAPFEAYSLRLVDLTHDVLAGDSVNVTFRFERAQPLTLQVPVRPRQQQAQPGHVCAAPSPRPASS